MRFDRFSRCVTLLALTCSLLLLSACATTESEENQIETRATARWEALLAGDLDGAYQYLSPGYRSSVSSLQYQRSILLQQLKWTSARYLESQCEETTCNVRFLVGFTVYAALPGVKSYNGTQSITESWVLADGNWYMVPKR
jgi:hypothetical protein